MIWVTDVRGGKIAINKDHIIAVFNIPEGEFEGKTAINVINGQIIVQESDIDVVGMLQ